MGRKEKLVLLIPALWGCVFDIAITAIHQPASYWNGDLSAANEANPIGAFFMRNHVSGFFIISGIWIMLVCTLGYYLPRRISRIFLLFVLMVHSVGASTWLLNEYGFWYVIVFNLFNAVLFSAVQDKVGKHVQRIPDLADEGE